jgi:hypothetical protein
LRAGLIQGRGLVVFGVQTKLEPFLLALHASDALKIVKNGLELRKLKPPKVKTSRTQKKQTTKHYKAHSKSLKKLLVCCSIVIRVLR